MSWTDQTPSGAAHGLNYSAVASNSAGTHLVAVVGTGDIWTN